MVPYILCTILFLIGIYGVVAKKNLVKILLGMVIMEYAANLMLILVGYRNRGTAPIVENAKNASLEALTFVDPLPQALVLTSIVIGLGMTVMATVLCLRLYEKYGTLDILHIRRLRG